MWLRAAAIGTALLVALFAGYEIAERYWLGATMPIEALFALHIYRGIGASVLVGTVSVLSIWRARRKYDEVFARAYAELGAAMKERSRELEQAQAFTERLFNSLRERIIVVDKNGVIVKANRHALEGMVGETPLGKACSILGTCSPASEGCAAMKAQRAHLPIVGQCVQTDTRTGRIYAIDAYPVPDIDGTGPLVIESARDITEAKQLETQLRYQEKLAALGVLATGIAHDIANPLASMSSELEMIEGESDLARVRASIGVVKEQVTRMGRTLREMTDFARRRGDETAAVPIDIAVDDALRMVRHDPRARRVRFSVEVGRDFPPLRMVEDHLVMVLVNLIINAFDAMPEGGSLTIRSSRDAGGVSLSISDTGLGMGDDVLSRAMEPLFTTKGRGRGTGLGLSVSADIVRNAGGTLRLTSKPGCGTTATLHFDSGAFDAPSQPEQEAAHG